MNKLLRKPIGILAALVMVLTMFVLPQAALAKVFLSNGNSSGSPGGGEGDPLDSNDYNSGGGDGEHQGRRVIPRGSDIVVYEILGSSQSVVLRMEIIGGLPVYTICIIDSAVPRVEASHVR